MIAWEEEAQQLRRVCYKRNVYAIWKERVCYIERARVLYGKNVCAIKNACVI